MNPFSLFCTYFKIGAMAFGGGYTMLPLLEREFVKKRHCIEGDDIFEMFALSQSIPGIIAVNMATFLGYRLGGLRSAIAAACGVMLPSIIIITVIAAFFQNFAEMLWVQSTFRGLNIAIVVLIINVLWKMARKNITDFITFGFFLLTVVFYFLSGLNPMFFVIFGVIGGLLLAGRGKSK